MSERSKHAMQGQKLKGKPGYKKPTSKHERSSSSADRRLKMQNLMRRKSLAPTDVAELKKLMEREKNDVTGDDEVSNPLALLG